MIKFDVERSTLVGPDGTLKIGADDEVARKFLMLIEGECTELGPSAAAAKYGFSKQRYFQLRALFQEQGTGALLSRKRGPKTPYRRTGELVRQVIRHRFLDPQASADVIAQKVRQCGQVISTRSVERVVADYGLQKKTSSTAAGARRRKR